MAFVSQTGFHEVCSFQIPRCFYGPPKSPPLAQDGSFEFDKVSRELRSRFHWSLNLALPPSFEENPREPTNETNEAEYLASTNPQKALRDVLRGNQFELQAKPQFSDPSQNKQGNFISPFDAVELLQKFEQEQQVQRQQNNGAEEQNGASGISGEEYPSSSLDVDEDLVIDGIQLKSDDYLKLSQLFGEEDPFQNVGTADGYSSVLFGALANQRGKDRSNDIKNSDMRYRSIVQNLAQPPPDVMAYKGPYSQRQGPQPTVNDLMSAWQKASIMKNRTSEELHKEVFEKEEGFQKQSKLFQESLSDSSRMREAMAQRHAAAYQARQNTAQAKLEKQMKEMQSILQRNEQTNCPICNCIMSPETWETTRKMYQGRAICDICYAEACLVERRRAVPPPRDTYMNRRSYGPISSSEDGDRRAGERSRLRKRFLARETSPLDDSDPIRDASQAPGMPRFVESPSPDRISNESTNTEPITKPASKRKRSPVSKKTLNVKKARNTTASNSGKPTTPIVGDLTSKTSNSRDPISSTHDNSDERTSETDAASDVDRRSQEFVESEANTASNGYKEAATTEAKVSLTPGSRKEALRPEENTFSLTPELDMNWVKAKDTITGKVFYWNRISGEIKFEDSTNRP